MPKQDHLEIIGPDGKISFHYLDPVKGITNIGTHPENDLVLESPHLAPFQAVIDHQRKPYRLMVLDEQANTRIQGKRIDSNIFQEIHDWETIELDGYSLTLLQDLDNLHAASIPTPVPTIPPTRVDTGALGGNGKAARQIPPVIVPVVQPDLPPSYPAPTQTIPAAPSSASRVSFYSSRPVDVRDDVIVAELSGREWTIDVEQTATCDLVVTNGGSIVASFDVTVEGLDQSWLTVYPPRVNLNEAGRATVTISMTPPRQSTSSAGPHHFSVAITSSNYSGHVTRLGATLNVNPYYEFSTGSLTPNRQTTTWRKRSAVTHFPIQNQGNSTSGYMVLAQDDENGCRFEFQIGDQAKLLKQAEVKVGAGQVMDIPITVSPVKRHLVRLKARQYHYSVITQPMDEPTTARTMSGSVISRPLFGLLSVLLALILLGVAVILLLRPRVSEFRPANSVIELGESTSLQWKASLPTTNLQITGIEEPITRGQRMVEVAPTSTGEKLFTLSGGNFLTEMLPFLQKSEDSAKILVVPPYPVITSFSVDRNDILQDDSITVKWSVESADEVILTVEGVPYSLKPDEFSGEKTLPVHDDSLVVLQAKNYSGVSMRSSFVEVNPPTIEIRKFEVTPSVVSLGEEITVEWEVWGIGIDEITITPYPGKIEIDPNTNLQEGKRTFKPKENLEFVLTVKSRNEVRTEIRPVIVGPAKVAPTIDYFKASPNKLAANDDKTVTFAWSVSGDVTSIKISSPNGYTSSELFKDDNKEPTQQGSLNTTVSKTSVFILTAANGNMVKTATVDIEVGEPKKPVEIQIVDVFPAMTIAQGIEVTVYYTVKPLVNGLPVNDPTTAGLPEVSGEVVVTDGQEQCAGELPILNCTFTPKTSGEHHITATYLGDDVYERRTTTYSKVLKVIGEDLKVMPPGITVNGTLTTTVGITSTIAFTLTPSSGTTPYPPSGLFYMLVGDEQICSNVQVLPVTGKNIAVGKCSTILDTIGEKQVAVFYRQDKIYNALDLTGKFNVIPASSEIVILSPLTGSFHINEDFEIDFQARNAGNINSTPSSGTVTILAPENSANTPCGTVGTNGLGSCIFSFSYSGTDTGSGPRSLKLEYSGDGQDFYASQSITYIYTILNDPPIAVNDSYTTNEDTSLVVSPPGILANDFDPEGETLTVTAYTAPFYGSLSGLSPQGGFIFNPGGDFTYLAVGEQSTAAFSYGITDGERDSGTASVSISVTGVNDAPNLPAIISPADNSERNPLNLTLQWTGIDPDTSDVLSYDVYFGTGANPPLVTTTGTNSYSLASLLPNTEYTWYITSKDSYIEIQGPLWSFTTAPLPGEFDKLTPPADEIDLIFPLTLTWEASLDVGGLGPDSYEICIDQVDNESCDTSWQSTGTTNNIMINRPVYSYNDTYYWQVRAVNNAGITYADGGTWFAFSTLVYPGPFQIVYPLAGSIYIPQPVALDWTDSNKANEYRVCYGTSVPPNICAEGIITSMYTIPDPLAPATTYYWQVWAINEAGETLPTSTNTYQYFLTAPTPGPFFKTDPNPFYHQPIPTTLTWTPSSNATDYEVCVNTTDTCDGWISVGNVTSTSVITYYHGITPTQVLTISPESTYYWQVRANNSFGTIYADGTDTGGVWSTFTTMSLPGDFSKSSPFDGALDLTIPLTLRWQITGTLTVDYEYCVNTSETCTEWLPLSYIGEVTINNLTGDTDYFWQVRARNGAGTTEADGGDWWMFNTHPKPDPFGKTNPISGTIDQLSGLTLSWQPSGGVNYYEYCYDTTDDDACLSWHNNAANTTIDITGLISDTTYYWQVRAYNVFGYTYADNGVYFNFSTLPPPGPFSKTGPDPAVDQPIPTTLSWSDSYKASYYFICVNTSATCVAWTYVGAVTSTQVTSYYPTSPVIQQPILPDTTYYWQVRAANHFEVMYADGDVNSGTWHSFTTMPLPDDFNKLTPDSGSVNVTLPLTLDWQDTAGADSYRYCYEPSWYTTKCDSETNWVDTGLETTAVITTGLQASTQYFWQVKAINGAGYKEAVDGWWSFTTMAAPGSFQKQEPTNGAVNQVIPLTLRWNASVWADSYEYCYYSTTEGLTKCQNDANWINVGASLTETLTTELTAGMTYTWQVRAVNSLSKTAADSGTWYSFSTLPAPTGFNKTAPTDNSQNREIPLTLSWGNSSNVFSYEYCYDTSDNNQCDLPSVWISVGMTNTAVISSLEANTEYFWQVRAVNPFTSTEANNGDWWSFKTKKKPAAFSKLYPINNATGLNKPLTLEWEASGGATYYEYCFDTELDSGCDGGWIRVDGGETGTITTTITNIVANQQYEWQVRARNSFDTTQANGGTWWRFTTSPVPAAFSKLSPTDSVDPLIEQTEVTLSWNPSSNAQSYAYCVYTEGTVNGCAADTDWVSTTETTATISGLIVNTTYHWQVKAINSFLTVEANGGDFWTFATIPMPGTFAQVSPASAAVDQKLPLTLEWGASEWASAYEYSLDTTGAFTNWQTPTGITSTVVTTLNPNTIYYWQVRSSNAFGTTYANGSGSSFTTQPLPASFDKTAPGDNSNGHPKSVTLTWTASDVNAESYEYCYDTTINLGCDGPWTEISTTSVTLDNLQPNEEYEWQVRAVNTLGETYASGGWWSFETMGLPATFPKSSPGTGSIDVELPVTLDWNPSTNADSYEYCYHTEITPTLCTNWTSALTNTQVILDSLPYSTTHYWQVRAVNTFGTTYADGEWWSFTTLRPPAAFEKSSPSDGATGLPLDVSISWIHPAGSSPVDTYTYCVSTTDDVCSGTWLTTTNTTVSLSGLVYNLTYYWQVKATNSAGTVFADGENNWYSFKTMEPPGSFNKTLPTNGATNQPVDISLTWSPSTGVDLYEYCIDSTTGTTCNSTWISTTNTTISLTGLSYNTPYYWHVRANNIAGTTYANGTDSWFSFTTVPAPPGPFNKLTPVTDSLVGNSNDVTLTWSESANATGYQYCFDQDNNDDCDGSWVSVTGLTATILQGSLGNNLTYYWQVRAVNAANDVILANGGGTWWSFTTSNN